MALDPATHDDSSRPIYVCGPIVRNQNNIPEKHPSRTKSLLPNPFPKKAATIPIKQSSAPRLEHASNTENLTIRAENS
jgi:hypothetical protein